jgi:2-keto-4-pentenoate hydratase
MDTSKPDLRAIALEIKEAQDSCRQVAPFTSRMPQVDLHAAYEVLHLVHGARIADGAKAVGRKIGFTNANLWPVYGVHAPIWGYVYDTTLLATDVARTTCSLAKLAEPRIEPEIVFRFRDAPRQGSSLEELLATIEWVACGFEIVQTQFPGWKFKAPDTVIGNSLHGRLVVGHPIPTSALGSDPLATLESFSLTLSRDGHDVETGKGTNVLGSPLKAIAHLLDVLAAQGNRAPVAAGEIVTTGTITMAYPIGPGETWSTRLDGIALRGVTLECT